MSGYGGMRRFRLDRKEDITGRSGTGCVAQGVVFSDGTVVMRWMTERRTMAFYQCLEDLEFIHLHHGDSSLRWEDPICWQCSASLEYHERAGSHCFACGAGQGEDLCFDTRPTDAR